MRRVPLCLLVIVACAAGVPAGAQPTPRGRPAGESSVGTLSAFAEVAQRTLRTHPEVAARRSAWEAQREIVEAVRAGRRPRVDLYAGAGTERAAVLGAAGAVRHATGASNRATLSVRQPLYDGAEVANEVERQSRIGNVRFHELRQAEDALVGDLAAAWVDVVKQRALIETSRSNVEAHERLLALVESRVRSGISRGVDLEQARARVASARLSLASDQGALAEALARYRRVAVAPAADTLVPITVPLASLPGSEADAVARALEYAPSIQGAAENEAAVAAELLVRRAAFAPRVAVEARHDLAARSALQSDTAYSSLLLTMNYNLYAGGGDAAREKDAAIRREQARAQLLEAKIVARQIAATAWSDVRRQAGIYENASNYVQSLQATRDAYRVQFDIGQRSLLDLLNTENEVTQARRLQLNSWADSKQAQLRLILLTGRLVEAFGLTLTPAEPLVAPPAERGDLAAVAAGADTAIHAHAADRHAGRNRSTAVAGRVEVDRVPQPVLDVDPRLPQAVWLGLLGWRDALAAGRGDEVARWYAGPAGGAAAAAWRSLAPDGSAVGRASRTRDDAEAPLAIRLLRAERTDAANAGAGNAQLMLVAVVGDDASPVCVRSAQSWRNEGGAGAAARWRIVRERATSADATACAR